MAFLLKKSEGRDSDGDVMIKIYTQHSLRFASYPEKPPLSGHYGGATVRWKYIPQYFLYSSTG